MKVSQTSAGKTRTVAVLVRSRIPAEAIRTRGAFFATASALQATQIQLERLIVIKTVLGTFEMMAYFADWRNMVAGLVMLGSSMTVSLILECSNAVKRLMELGTAKNQV